MTGDGKWCEYINQCAINNGGCDEMVTCTNTNPGRKCGKCPSGYQGNGVYCKKSSLCDGNNGGCSPFATCTEDNGQPKCTCAPGYTGNGVGPDGCKQSEGTCDLNCLHGVCVIQSGNPTCICYQGWSGDMCDQTMDTCLLDNPCLNGGTCVSGPDARFTCKCTDEFTGFTCEQPIGLCGGELTGETGTVSYPGSGNLYPNNAKCAWTIVGEEGQVIELTFTLFDLEPKVGSTCHDKLEVFDYLALEKPRELFSGCGNTMPSVPKSETNAIEIHFTSDARQQGQGFSVNWVAKKGECGGRISTPSGVISSPGFPNNIPTMKRCKWQITVESTKIVEITFVEFEMPQSSQCTEAYVALYNGIEETTSLQKKTCGNEHIDVKRSKGPFVTVDFKTGSSGNYKGFKLNYQSLDNPDSCGGDLTDLVGEVTSPGYPQGYQNNQECVWKILAKEGQNIMWTFHEITMEHSSNCMFDYVSVGYGSEVKYDEIHVLFETFCGFHVNDTSDAVCDETYDDCQELPLPIYSQKNELIIKFVSDISGNPGRGFSGSYEPGCGGRVTKEGIIRSPYYPDSFPVEKKCFYNIVAAYHQYVKLHFNVFSLGSDTPSTHCSSYIGLYDGLEETEGNMIFKGCGNYIPDDKRSTGPEMLLVFSSDGTADDHGFEAVATFTHLECGSFYDASQDDVGYIKSPGFPLPYPENLDCLYFITASDGFVIQLDFISFDIEKSSKCTWDYVALFDGPEPDNSTFIGQYCGKSPPGTTYSTGKALTIELVSDGTGQYDGFEASYRQLPSDDICGGFLGGFGGLIETNSYPNAYPPNQDCRWQISLNPGVIVELQFLTFNVQYSANCANAAVTLYAGLSEHSHDLGTYCGSEGQDSYPSSPVLSTSNQMTISFISDDGDGQAYTGFQARYNGELEGCGGLVQSAAGKVHSPNYPNEYPADSHCEYIIETNPGNGLILKFEDFVMEKTTGCSRDYVKIFDGNGISGAPLTEAICEETILDITISTNSSTVTVLFVTDGTGEEKGWLLGWTSR